MLRMLEAQAPAKQTVTDTINTLSSRLASATLLEDRRAAILGLRSFAKQFPASVASGALRDLLAGLRKDGEDSDTIKVVLETLLMLFEPDEKSPEASEEITLWLADEFTQRQDNITALLDLLETGEFYLRLYSLQILSHVCAARPERASEVVLAAPLGISRITVVLDETREAVRNEALLLLVALSPSSTELQKVIAFENAFDRIFALIDNEGGLTHGSTTVQDCLSLLANLLTLNTSNQSYFREIGCVGKLAKLLNDVVREEHSPDGVSDWLRPKRDMNLWGLLGIAQLFLVKGFQGTMQSQTTFWQTGILLHALEIAFNQSFGTNVRAKSLDACGDIIRNNAVLQEQFGDLGVPYLRDESRKSPLTNGHATPISVKSMSASATPAPTENMNVIEALLQLTLEPATLAIFDVRLAACNCVKAFIEGHNGIKSHVLRRAIEGHESGEDSIPNVLTVLLEPSSVRSNSDPYQVWMAAVLLLHLLHENPETKSMALKLSEGNADEGEEVVTFIQSLASNVIAGVQHVEDERALIGHLMLLCIWLFEDPDAVNDLLGEGSNVQGLSAAVKVSSTSMPLVAGLCSFLLGTVYEFSTKDSPIPRVTLQSVILKVLSREIYIDRLAKLRESPYVRDFEVLPITLDGSLPDVFFDKTFMDFLKDNFSRIRRAIDREPSFETSIISNGIQKGISRELVDNLRAELEEKKSSQEQAQDELQQIRQSLEKEKMEHRKLSDQSSLELNRIKQINESLQRNHDAELLTLRAEVERQRTSLNRDHELKVAQVRKEHETIITNLNQKHQQVTEELSQRYGAEKRYLEQRQSGHERELVRTKDNLGSKHKSEIELIRAESKKAYDLLQTEIDTLKIETGKSERLLRQQLLTVESSLKDAQSQLSEKAKQSDRQLQDLEKSYSEKLVTAEAQIKTAENKAEKAKENAKESQNKVSTLQAEVKLLKEKLTAADDKTTRSEDSLKKTESRAKKAEDQLKKAENSLKKVEERAKKSEEQLKKGETKVKASDAKSSKATDDKITGLNQEISALKQQVQELKPLADKAREVQTELDDLLVVFADLEAKRSEDKKRLKELGEEISEDEDGAEEEEEEEEGDGEEGDVDEDDDAQAKTKPKGNDDDDDDDGVD